MKTLTIAFALLASLNLFAQEPVTTTEPQKQDAVQKAQPDGLTMQDNKVCLIENGLSTEITEEIWTKNGMQVTPSGRLTFPNGEKAQLRNGEFVSLKGAVARPVQIGTEVAAK